MEKDWRENGDCLVDVQDQGKCSCCWAIVACNAISAAQRIHFENPLVIYSYQQLIDCTKAKWKSEADDKCKPCSYVKAFDHIITNGVALAEHYPFARVRNPCHLQSHTARRYQMISGYQDLKNDREAVLEAINRQPVCAWIYVTNKFKEYSGDGVYILSEEEENQLNRDIARRQAGRHAVLVVGYGMEDNIPCFLIQNSWGTAWGNNGYAKIERRLLNDFCYPHVEDMKVAMGTDFKKSTSDQKLIYHE